MSNNLTRVAFATGILIVAIVAARVGSMTPVALLALPIIAGVVAVVLATRRWPRALATIAVFALLIAGTKFRMRDPMASVLGEFDWQVILELALFALVGVVILGMVPLAEWRIQALVPGEVMLSAYAALALCSAAWSFTPELTIVRAVQLLILLAFALVVPRVLGPRRTMHAVGSALLAYCAASAVLAKFFMFAKGTQVDYSGFHRFTWFAVHPIDAATLVAIAIIFLLAGLLIAPKPWRLTMLGLPSWLYLLPLVAVLVVTHSRGPLFALVASAGLLFLRRRVGMSGFTAMVSIVLSIVIIVVSSVRSTQSFIDQQSGGLVDRVVLRGQNADEFASLSGRSALWTEAAGLFKESPVLGVGYQGSRPYLLEVANWAAYAHDALLQTLVDLGIVGALLLWIPLIRTVFVGSLTDPAIDPEVLWQRGLTFGLAVFVLVNSFSNESFAAAPSFQTLVPLLCVTVGAQIARRARVPRSVLSPAWYASALQGARS